MTSTQTVRVRGKYFKIPNEWTKDDVVKYWNMQSRGVIVVCPECGKVDIDITSHFSKCNPDAEQMRQENLEHYK